MDNEFQLKFIHCVNKNVICVNNAGTSLLQLKDKSSSRWTHVLHNRMHLHAAQQALLVTSGTDKSLLV